MRISRSAFAFAFVLLPSIASIAVAQVAPIKPRISVLVDTSGSMLDTPQIITFPESTTNRAQSCSNLAFNGCTSTGALSLAQQTCNACVADTIHFRATCSGNWDATCRADYGLCYRALTGAGGATCNQDLAIVDGILTRGDGTLETPGCDLNGDGKPNDSRLFQAKAAVSAVVATFGEVEFALWRYKGEDSNPPATCNTAADCPKTPGGLTVFSCDTIGGVKKCNLNAVNQDHCPNAAGCVRNLSNSPNGAREVGTVVTFTTTAAHDFNVGSLVTVAGVGVAGYNGTWTVTTVPSTTTFTATLAAGLANSGGGNATLNPVGQCSPNSWNGADATFTCASCDDQATYERAECDAEHLDSDRTGATTLFPGSSAIVNCALGTTNHPNYKYIGAAFNGTACDPDAGERLVDFPPTGFDDNYPNLIAWMDNDGTEVSFASDVELKAAGATPIAGSLKSMLPALQATIAADTKASCRPYKAIIVTDGGETCETVANAKTAAAALFANNPHIPVYVIGFAICPGGGTACQTATDLNGIAASGGTTSAFFANDQLSLQATLAQIVQSSVVSEKCNGADDDCDIAVDEDFPGKGNACSVGVGECKRNGTLVCTADQLGLQCSATPGAPTGEICNGLDDDCNGLIDDGINCSSCVPSCLPTAGCDICNGKDDDCDGKTDEDFAPGSCGTNIGTCLPGVTTCTAGVVACSGGQGPVSETCNNKDDDCDTIVDGMTDPCYPVGLAGCDINGANCKGICKGGVSTCTAGVFGTCTGFQGPVTEIACNGLDDDCDGLVDEGKGPELCDGLDNDCDGKIDEGVDQTDPGLGGACGTGPFVGQCAPGTVECVGGAKTCVGEIKPSPEVCDNVDNNCNGQTDENVPGFGGSCGTSTGDCSPGTLLCQGGQAVCVGGQGPVAEKCDGHDNNCNGMTDETDPNLGMTCNTLPNGQTVPTQTGECKFGVLACTAGALTCVGTVGPTAELCNRLDDDCDGSTDEDFPQLGAACDNGQTGICKQTGVYVCAANGQGVVCTAPAGTPGTETCNGLDDDCDGTVDELPMPVVGTVCAPANGMCAPGLWECQSGALVCGAPSSGQTETCNLKDDDCDGLVDEEPLPGEGNNCTDPGFETIGDTGECDFGKTKCKNGDIVCDGYKGPQPEICDGKDNDCDGIVDESASCPTGNACNGGECVAPCASGEFPCAAGYQCLPLTDPPGNYCIPDPCNGVTCPTDQYCDHTDGKCVDLCAGITCSTGEVCRQGFCLDCFHLPDLCTPGQLCIADNMGTGQCQDNPCDPNPCQAGQTCANGVCSDACAGGCAEGQVCVGGTCTSDACATQHCAQGQVCDPSNGKCVSSMCDGVGCHEGEVCVPTTGACEPDPCLSTVCPDGQVCTVDPDGSAVCGAPSGVRHDRVTAAGGGCSAGGGAASAWLFAMAIAIPFVRRRRRARAGGAA